MERAILVLESGTKRIIDFNHHTIRLLRFVPKELLALSFQDFFSRDVKDFVLEGYLKALHKSQCRVDQVLINRKDGPPVPVSIEYQCPDPKGNVTVIIYPLSDQNGNGEWDPQQELTELRQAYRRLSDLNLTLKKRITHLAEVLALADARFDSAQDEMTESLRQKEGTKKECLSLMASIIRSVEERDPLSRGHSDRVVVFAFEIAQALKRPEKELDIIHNYGALYDIGKVGIAEATLTKQNPLTDEERLLITDHPVIGTRILKHIPWMEPGLDLVRHHHERYDGSGYPDGLKGKDIPLLARIFMVADAFEAMTRDRAYRRRLPVFKAIQELERLQGAQFDPGIVDTFKNKVLSSQPHLLNETNDESAA
ncbi:MAG: HD domain-containing protein [Candidatus Omnitrophica bacterium]|nr:HD domain-containing protein [Candidatus Omnitrophota bacterium]